MLEFSEPTGVFGALRIYRLHVHRLVVIDDGVGVQECVLGDRARLAGGGTAVLVGVAGTCCRQHAYGHHAGGTHQKSVALHSCPLLETR
ncbi:hypothetical protein D3C85_1273640 [compost metagenome]